MMTFPVSAGFARHWFKLDISNSFTVEFTVETGVLRRLFSRARVARGRLIEVDSNVK